MKPLRDHSQENTFLEKFCGQYGVSPASYEYEVLRRCLYPVGRLLLAIVGDNQRYFLPDREFIRGAGKIRKAHEHRAEVWAFTCDPENRRFTRRYLKCRVSAGKLYTLMKAVLDSKPPAETRHPLGSGSGDFDQSPSPAN